MVYDQFATFYVGLVAVVAAVRSGEVEAEVAPGEGVDVTLAPLSSRLCF